MRFILFVCCALYCGLCPAKESQINQQLDLAHHHRQLGANQQSQAHLQQAMALAVQPAQKIPVLLQQSQWALENNQLAEALHCAEQARDLTKPTPAQVFNQLAKVALAQQQTALAADYYQQAAQIADNPLLKQEIIINQWALAQEQNPADETLYWQARQILLKPSLAALKQQLKLARLALLLPDNSKLNQDLATLLRQTLEQAKHTQQAVLVSMAHGYLSQFYQQQQKDKESLQHIRQAIFIAQQEQTDDLLYLWYAQLARLFAANDPKAAIDHYRRAIQQLQLLRPVMSRHDPHFYYQVMPVYLALVDLLLQQADKQPHQAQTYLLQARDVLEQYKTVELENYFHDPCVAPSKPDQTTQLPPHVAVLHPVLLPNRTVLLLSFHNRLQQISVAGQDKDLHRQLRHFLKYLDQTTGKRLYDWLLQPIQAALKTAQIDTLVIVPQGKLLTLPFAALFDGKHYLIQQFALVTTPALHLTDLNQLQASTLSLLLGGLSEPQKQTSPTGLRNFGPLPHVSQELQQIYTLYGGDKPLLNKDFILPKLYQALQTQNYTMIHFATHGEFNRNTAKSFVLTYDSQLAMDQLKALLATVKKPLDLLTLSACETAVGDDEQAALGLAGLAIKSGAHSVLASLWPVYDDATAVLIPDFYAQLKKHNKAKALQQAQRHMLAQPRYQHPKYWASFILIGRWF
jgi:CHAT domain-containing protein